MNLTSLTLWRPYNTSKMTSFFYLGCYLALYATWGYVCFVKYFGGYIVAFQLIFFSGTQGQIRRRYTCTLLIQMLVLIILPSWLAHPNVPIKLSFCQSLVYISLFVLSLSLPSLPFSFPFAFQHIYSYIKLLKPFSATCVTL